MCCLSLSLQVERDLLSPLESAGFTHLPVIPILRMNRIVNTAMFCFASMVYCNAHAIVLRPTRGYCCAIIGVMFLLSIMNTVATITWEFGPHVVPRALGDQKEAVDRFNQAVCDTRCHQVKSELTRDDICGEHEVLAALSHAARKMSSLSVAWCESHFGYGGSSIIARDAMESPFKAMTMKSCGDTELYFEVFMLQFLVECAFNAIIVEVCDELEEAHRKWRRTQVRSSRVREDSALLVV